MNNQPETPENIKIFIPNSDIKDKYGFIDEMFSGDTKQKLNFLQYKAPDGLSKEEYFEKICEAGLKERYGETLNDEITERYNKEKSAILKQDKVDAFLHWYDIIQLAKNNNIMLGTGRGSAVGSLICYILGITNVDPVKYNLVFERFISQNRIWFPDISLDIEEENSDILINLILKKYGSENVATAVEPSYSPNIEDERAFQIFLFVTEKPIKNYVPVEKIAPNTYLTTEHYEMFDHSECLKFSFHFSKVLNRIKKSGININEIPLDDKNTFSVFQSGKTQGIYCYGKMPDEVIKDLKRLNPQSIDDLSAFFALNRPTTFENGMFDDFINAKNLKNKKIHSDLIEPVLFETYGEIIYQEQIIQILNIIGNFSLSTADTIRRYMARKNNSEMMLKYEKDFIENAISKEIEYTKAKDIWDKMYQVSEGCFMKAHALSFSLLSYYDAYIQTHKCTSEQTPVRSGFDELDKLSGGFNPGELIIIAGRPSMGKTAFAINLFLNAGLKVKKNVAFFSLEMNKEQIVRRMSVSETGIGFHKIKSGELSSEEYNKIALKTEDLSGANLFIDDTPGMTVDAIKEKCRQANIAGNNFDMIIIDYLQLMDSDTPGNDRTTTVSDIIRNLKQFARELNIPIVLLSQLSRSVEARNDKHPLLTDLRDSGATEQDSDKVLFIYRNEYYYPGSNNEAEIIVAKNRNGETGTVKLLFDKETVKFKEFENE